jgi:predicted tellurium resistance membrane protein TerC
MTLFSVDAWISFLTLSAMEIVLGIDNIVFLTILVGRVPAQQRNKIRRTGLLLALLFRLALLFSLSWLMRLDTPLVTIANKGFSGRGLILLSGGLFLIGKSSHEVYEKLEKAPTDPSSQQGSATAQSSAVAILVQIILIDIVFSLDSVITAIGMAQQISIMVMAMCTAVVVMLVFAKAVGEFVDNHPSVKILALTFLMLIGVMLVAEAFGQHIGKGYIYFAMSYALLVEVLNLRFRKKHAPVHLHQGMLAPTTVSIASKEQDS